MSFAQESTADSYEEHLIACIEDSISLFLFDNACFLAERLLAQRPDDVSTCIRLRMPDLKLHVVLYASLATLETLIASITALASLINRTICHDLSCQK